MPQFNEVYNYSLSDPTGFWTEAADAIHWEKKWDKIFGKKKRSVRKLKN